MYPEDTEALDVHDHQSPDTIAGVLLSPYMAKWEIDWELIRVIFFLASCPGLPQRLCMEGYLGRTHKDRDCSSFSCRRCGRIESILKKCDSVFGTHHLDAWNTPRKFCSRNN